MCRFLIFKGPKSLVADLVTRPEHSIIKQSYSSQERSMPLNGDGFGLGWYDHDIEPTPGLFTSLTPAWANLNLVRLSDKIRTTCLFAHIRAASPGLLVTKTNCHPFQYDRFLWMHNGLVQDFAQIKRKLRSTLSDSYYHMVQGTTDSEHAFALFLNFLGDDPSSATLEELAQAMSATIAQLDSWSQETRVPSDYNFAVTNGNEVVVTRYVNRAGHQPESLYYSYGSAFECRDGICRMRDHRARNSAVIVASEPITAYSSEWERIAPNTLLMVDANNAIHERAL